MSDWYWPRRNVDPTSWVDDPSETWFSRIFGGLIVPVGMLVLGVWVIVTQHAWLPTRYGIQTFHGREAILLGISGLGAAVFFHGYCFWGPILHLQAISQILKFLGALTFAAAFGYFVWAWMWL